MSEPLSPVPSPSTPKTGTPARRPVDLPGGALCVSLDFELYWGVRDKRTLEQYRQNLMGVRPAIDGMLRIFDGSGIHATWAIVGLLFFEDQGQARANLPSLLPRYAARGLSPYEYLDAIPPDSGQLHFAPDVIREIGRHAGQEIATHTFSHYYCLEAGQSLEEFRSDLQAAVRVAGQRGLSLASLVFPRNQWNPAYLPVLSELGLSCYRGNQRSWLYRATGNDEQGMVRRAGRLLDAYVNLNGHHTYPLHRCAGVRPIDLPASRFLRPYSRRLAPLEGLRLRRILKSMDYAARHGEVFHLWWHPHNFGANTAENLEFLGRIASHFRTLQTRYGMASLSMGELAVRLDDHAVDRQPPA